ncbi:MAG TPA: phosphate ABC transporter permease PtsA [Planctomycetes bacterium]|nr:phosphate ABC transporter permease PtsA [Planctomycetota bacterium]
MPKLSANGRPAGEPLVWLTSMGLAVGLTMVAALLWVIVVNGASVFWPKRIQAWTVQTDGATQTVWGELAKSQPKKFGGGDEIQVFTGTRDALGSSFRYIDATAITAVEQPTGLMAIERLEYGDAIGLPVRLQLADGTALAADDPAFRPRLAALVAEIAARREEISVIEKGEIGLNSREIYRNDLRIKAAKRRGTTDPQAEAEIVKLKAAYELLAAKATALREKQTENRLFVKVMTGKERRIPLGTIVAYHFPNELGLGGRLALTASNLWGFLTENPREANTEGGIFPAIVGTFVMTLLMSVCVTPFGVLAAIYLREYAKQGPFVRAVRIAINNLAGVPSIVFGVFGLGFFVYGMGGSIDSLFFEDRQPTPTYGTGGIMWAAATLALMTVPVVIVATEESIAAVGRGAREGSLALGASKWQTIQRIVLPAAVPGILTGLILAMARGAGEVAPLMLVGVVKLAPSLPVDGLWNDTDLLPFFHLDQKFMHLGFHIYDLGFQSPDSDAAKPMVFATTFFLICLVLVLNLTAILMREKLRKKFATGVF